MIFIKFTYYDKRVFGFCLDDVLIFEAERHGETKITLSDGREENLEIDIEDFCAKVFSDENESKEYNLVEMEGNGPAIDWNAQKL